MTTLTNISAQDLRADTPRPGLLARIWTALCESGDKHCRRDQITYLESLSDAELAKRGIRRDGIASYVFRDLFYT